MMLSIEMLPAQHGDCLWIEYGDPGETRRILVDCGLRSTYRDLARRLKDLPDLTFELLILTHIDADHIEGAIPLLQEVGPERFGDVWFNGWKHLPLPPDALGALHGEIFSALLTSRGFSWNRRWQSVAVVLPDDGPLPRITLDGGLTLTLLSPTRERLADLKTDWNDELEKLGLEPGDAKDTLAALEDRPKLQPDALGQAKIDIEALSEAPFKPDEGRMMDSGDRTFVASTISSASRQAANSSVFAAKRLQFAARLVVCASATAGRTGRDPRERFQREK